MKYYNIIIYFKNADIKVLKKVNVNNLQTIIADYTLNGIVEIKLIPYIL